MIRVSSMGPHASQHRVECIRELDETFARRSFDDWRERLAHLSGVWAPAITLKEVHDHVQVEPNGYLREGHRPRRPRVQARRAADAIRRRIDDTGRARPGAGQHTEAILLDVGLAWDDITRIRDAGGLG